MLALDRLAFDRGTIRSLDKDNRLHIDPTPISKAMVCPYIGHEIPGWEELGLDPEKVYRLYRDPAELEKSAGTFNKIPVLSAIPGVAEDDRDHVPVSAEEWEPLRVVGSTGERAEYRSPYLMQSIVIWAGPAIDGVTSDSKKQLSAAYHYRPDMKPGTANGESFDGVMRDIVGNHVAIVETGRAGADVVVGDSAINLENLLRHKDIEMAKAKKIDFTPVLKNSELAKLLAKDATPEGLSVLLDALSMCKPEESMDAGTMQPAANAPPAGAAAPVVVPDAEPPATAAGAAPAPAAAGGADPAAGGDPVDALKKWLASKLQPQDMAMLEQMIAKIGAGGGEGGAEKPAPAAADDDLMPGMDGDEGAESNAPPVVDPMQTRGKAPGAMDAITKKDLAQAMKLASDTATKIQRDIRDAEREIRPHVGDLAMSFDSAADVRRHALKMLKVEGADTVHESALSAMLKLVPIPGSEVRPVRESRMGMDAAAVKSLDERFGLNRIGIA